MRIHPLLAAVVASACGTSPAPVAEPPAPESAEKRFETRVGTPSVGAAAAPVMEALRAELERTGGGLSEKADPPPYFLSYQAVDGEWLAVHAAFGALQHSQGHRMRHLDVDLRVGDYTLDNTHPLRGPRGMHTGRGATSSTALPLGDDAGPIRVAAWRATEHAWQSAVERYTKVKANRAVKVAEEDPSPDFSPSEPVTHLERPATLEIDPKPFEALMRRVSSVGREHPDLLSARADFTASAETRYLLTTDGTRVQLPRTHVRVTVSASTRAEDGMSVSLSDSFDASSPAGLPTEEEITAAMQQVIDTVLALREAPVAEPFTGPAILEGRAAGVFFHEIFGHRIEGHRQKREQEGQTFTKKVGEEIMPTFIDVYDDPTLRVVNDIELNGYYAVDDEGVKTQRVSLVDGGTLRGFLMSRSPIEGFSHSNGHGRRQMGYAVVARQGNLVVDPRVTVTREELEAQLVDEIRRQNKPYGLLFSDLSGGYTTTQRAGPQAFKVLPLVVHRVYADGRKELIRGADLEGTPLSSLTRIVAAANDYQVFNGHCGAESGQVPVSAVSPSLLLSQVEVTRQAKSQDRPPLLPAPTVEDAQ